MKTFAAVLLSVLFLSVEVLAAPPEADFAQVQTTTEALFTSGLDLADVKLAIDRMVDPTVNRDAGLREIDRMASDVAAMAGDNAGSAQRLEALKRYLYEAGSWNGGRPFQYDITDPLGENPASRKLLRYLETRRGNCVTMPILLLLVGERLGLKLTLAEAPLHLFVKYTDDDGRSWNLEATSGAGFTRDAWYRQRLPMTDEAVRNGVYLRALAREVSDGLRRNGI